MIYKVGDRVRIIRTCFHPENLGREATVIGPLTTGRGFGVPYEGYPVDIDGFGQINKFDCQVILPPSWLAPLTPPAEDTWAADKVRQVTKPQHVEPVAPPAKVIEELRALDRELRGVGVSIFRNL